MMASSILKSLAVVVPSVLAGPAVAQECRLALVLALDVSGSVSAREDRLQREGLAAALRAPEVERAFLTGGQVALYVFEWAGERAQGALLPGWQTIESEEDLLRLAAVVEQAESLSIPSMGLVGDGTAVGAALVHAAMALEEGPDCARRTVDVAGDGVNSQGVEPGVVLDSLYEGITVNALVIDEPVQDAMLHRRSGRDVELVTWFRDAVLHGPGAFAVRADGYEDYARAMTAKLLRELTMPLVGGVPLGAEAG